MISGMECVIVIAPPLPRRSAISCKDLKIPALSASWADYHNRRRANARPEPDFR
jgi:hypothetical protein